MFFVQTETSRRAGPIWLIIPGGIWFAWYTFRRRTFAQLGPHTHIPNESHTETECECLTQNGKKAPPQRNLKNSVWLTDTDPDGRKRAPQTVRKLGCPITAGTQMLLISWARLINTLAPIAAFGAINHSVAVTPAHLVRTYLYRVIHSARSWRLPLERLRWFWFCESYHIRLRFGWKLRCNLRSEIFFSEHFSHLKWISNKLNIVINIFCTVCKIIRVLV